MNSRTALLAALLSSASFSAVAQETNIEQTEGIDTSGITDTIVVRGQNIPDEKRATSEISAVLDEEAFDRTGDSNIADALRRVTGLSLADGKFVIVRGLNERYSSATLNGSTLPSPEPLRRVAPLDLFPTSVLSGSLVQKTFSPEQSGEFGGGSIDLRTRSLPNESFFEIEGTVALDTVSTGSDGLTYDGGDLDWLGFDDGTRSVPGPLEPFFLAGPQLTPGLLGATQQNEIDASINNSETLVLFNAPNPVNWGVRASGGAQTFVNDDITIGFVSTIGLSTEFVNLNGARRRNTAVNSADQTFDPNQGLTFQIDSTQQNVLLNGLLSVGLELFDNHEITGTAIYLRSTTKEARIQEGLNNDRNRVRSEFSEFFEREVFQFQADAEHNFPALADLGVNWRVSYGEAFRDSPYERRTNFLFNEGNNRFEFDFSGQQTDFSPIQFSRLDDENFGAGVDFVLPFTLGDNPIDLEFGYAFTDKARVTFDRRYFYSPTGGALLNDLAASRPDVIFSDAVTGSSLLTLQQAGVGLGNPDNFAGNLEVHAGYAGIDAELSEYIRVAAGVRYETSEQTTQTSVTGAAGSAINFAPIDEDYFLPAVTVTWNPTGNIQLRGGFSQTIVRPQFREIAPVFFTNPDTDIPTFGNPTLVNSEIDNYDARLEWYFGRGQFLTIGGFYKDITNPIEEINSSGFAGGDQGGSSFVNSPSAEVYGGEFEFQKNFDMSEWFDDGWLGAYADTKELVFIANYTYAQSDVQGGAGTVTQFLGSGQPIATAVTIVGDRSLQGQSDHLANVQIGYRDLELDSQATLLFNYASRRIQQIGGGAPNNQVDELPPVLLDFVWTRDLDLFGQGERNSNIEFKVQNILGDDFDAKQVTATDSIVFDRYDIGRTFSLQFKHRF